MRRLKLDRALLLACEDDICAHLRQFFSFRGHALYFPSSALAEAELLAAERRVLAPILHEGKPHGALRLDNVHIGDARAILPYLARIISLCLANVLSFKTRDMDGQSGLLTEHALLARLGERIQSPAGGAFPVCHGIITLSWPQADSVARRIGHETRDRIWREAGRRLRKMLPSDCLAAQTGATQWMHEYTVIMPASGRGACHKLAKSILSHLKDIDLADKLADAPVGLHIYGGHSLFPQDLRGADLRRPAAEQVLLLRDRARIAAVSARRSNADILAFAWLLRRGGIVTAIERHNFLRISLGWASLAQPGMRFHVYGPAGMADAPRAQIILRHVGEDESLAEIFHMECADNPPLPGDSIGLIGRGGRRPDSIFMEQAAFLEQLPHLSQGQRQFCLSISRFSPTDNPDPAPGGNPASGERNVAAWLEQAWRQMQEKSVTSANGAAGPQELATDHVLPCADSASGVAAGRIIPEGVAGQYGRNGLIVFWPATGAETVCATMARLHELAVIGGLQAATGVFEWPCLNFDRAESEACCLKALEYARLLPAPHIGKLDFLALTISADKRMSQGDQLGAIEEYRLALLLKPDDALATNSLAVCMAALNRQKEARDLFERALELCQDTALRARICYNLANISLKTNAVQAAISLLKQCISQDGAHAFAWLRLGQIHAQNGRPAVARAMFRHVERIAQDTPEILNTARRSLARLEKEHNRTDEVRDILHDALVSNPADTAAMLLLAESYIDDDPALAELLARKCLRLGADAVACQAILARALVRVNAMGEAEQPAGQTARKDCV